MNKDSRIEQIFELIEQLDTGNLQKSRTPQSRQNDGLDEIIIGLNKLKDRSLAKQKKAEQAREIAEEKFRSKVV